MDFTFLTGIFASPWDIIRNLVDIAIISYILYRLLGLIKGTRAEQLLKGLVLLLIFTLAAGFLKLTMVNWLTEKLWILFAITLPIVFQPEIRRFLEQLGRGGLFGMRSLWSDKGEYDEMVAELCLAAQSLSRSRTGALIVVARKTGIGEYLESGARLDALVSASLLQTIFFPNTPLHDGAVVIRNTRIERAGCFLPLSDNPALDRQLGTRHRAALGISEVSDAVVLIVSEETGQVSLAYNGEIKRDIGIDELKLMLEKKLGETGNDTSWFRR
ncbi:diadenylate cyclase CdaA [Syntrophomonas palmitatica]|uniref:diadenylate cyclase CdaA n=1 Tax=Syntrophomonas palmitatica TaxID=402877 RepID=UPI0009F874DC|nr:diadenylate cyclase CdaA [Syntrophomonas palmitatica]